MEGVIYIVSGFSESGKSSLCKEALANVENTTRSPRGQEDDGYLYGNEFL